MHYAILCYNDENAVWAWSKEEDAAVMARLATVRDRLSKAGSGFKCSFVRIRLFRVFAFRPLRSDFCNNICQGRTFRRPSKRQVAARSWTGTPV